MSPKQVKTGPLEALRSAVEAVARSRGLLTSASIDTLSRCEGELEAAVQSLEQLARDWKAETELIEKNGVSEATRQLQSEVSAFDRLLRQAQEFHQGWAALTDSSLAGYTASGDPAPVGQEYSRLAVKG